MYSYSKGSTSNFLLGVKDFIENLPPSWTLFAAHSAFNRALLLNPNVV
jgi:hypothetical protein